jgi:DNA-binding winged helix-turn-helix (wHTH) protein
MINNPSVGNGIDDDQTSGDRFASRFDAGKGATMDAVEIAANYHFVPFGDQVLDRDFVTRKRPFYFRYVLCQSFIGDILPNKIGRLGLTAQRAKIIGDQSFGFKHISSLGQLARKVPTMGKENSKKNQRTTENSYRFGEFEFNPAERILSREGEAIALAPKAFDALLCLVRNAEHLVSKRDLMDTLWPSTFVSEANLTNTVVSLRKVLGQDAIRTVSKYGYRFVLPVQGEPGMAREIYEKFARAKELTVQRSLESMTRARELYWLCLADDPGFAPGWAWLGRCCWFLGKFSGNPSADIELADAAFRRAFLIDPDLACAHQFYTPMEADIGEARRALARLLSRLERNPGEPESFTGLVQVLRFCGLLRESVEAHERAMDLDPTVVTSVPHTLFLAGDYAASIETYSGRASYYLDAAAWAALGDKARASTLLRERLARMPLSELMKGLMASLLALLEERFDEAFNCMEAMKIPHEPEVLVYLARHYAYLGSPDSAIKTLKRAAQSGFVCAPETLRSDFWLRAARAHPEFGSLLTEAEGMVDLARPMLQRCSVKIWERSG